MTWPMILTWIAVILLFIVGLAGIVLPVLPGIMLIFAGTLLFALVDGFQSISGGLILFFAILSLLVTGLEYAAGLIGAKRYEASRWGLIGAVLGLIVGLFFGPLGLILGPLAGAIALELIAGRTGKEALRAGWGTFVGFLGGVIIKLAAAFTIIGLFFYKVITG